MVGFRYIVLGDSSIDHLHHVERSAYIKDA